MRSIRYVGMAVLLLAVAAPVSAQRFGVQASWGSDFDFGIGARLEYDLPGLITDTGAFSRTFLLGSFDYFFPGCDSDLDSYDCSYWEANANLAIPLTASGIDPYVGAGLNIAHFSADWDDDITEFDDASSTDLGLNLLGGLRFMLGNLDTFAEARFELGGGEQLVLTGGILLGGSR